MNEAGAEGMKVLVKNTRHLEQSRLVGMYSCYNCESELEVEEDDFKWEDSRFSDPFLCARCPVCRAGFEKIQVDWCYRGGQRCED